MYGWKPQPKDGRDWIFGASNDRWREYVSKAEISAEPSIVDLLPPLDKSTKQGAQNSCVAHVLAVGARMLVFRDTQDATWRPSRRQLYWQGRRQSGRVWGLHRVDEGGYPRDFLKALKKYGVSSEAECPYDKTKVNKPIDIDLMAKGLDWRGLEYYWIRGDKAKNVKEALFYQCPVGIGIMAGPEWHSYDYPEILTVTKEPKSANGHYVMVVKYLGDGKWLGVNWWKSFGLFIFDDALLKSARDVCVMQKVERTT